MFTLCRIAARAVFTQPTRQLATSRPAQSRISILRLEQAPLCRAFHQSRQWLTEEQKSAEQVEVSPAEAAGGETVTTEPSAKEQNEIREESVATPEVTSSTQQPADTSSQLQQAAQNAAGAVQDGLSGAFSRRLRGPRDAQVAPSKILYIGNLFFEVTDAQLEAEFSRFGGIANSRIVTDARGLSKGFGYLEFNEQSSADRAIEEMNQKPFAGRRMSVQYHARRDVASGKHQSPPSKTLFIGNMSYQMSDRDLNDLFREVRNVLDVRVAIDRRSGQPRGFAHADFVDVASAQRAKELLEQKLVYGRQLRVDYSMSSAQTRNT